MTSSRMGTPAFWTRSWLVLSFLAPIAFLALSGCATRAGDGALEASRADLVTESDEPETRRRARIRLELAVGYFEQGQTTVALDELKQSLGADPTFADAYDLRGLIYMRLNDMRLAEESFRRAFSLNPRNAGPLHNLGWLMCQQARYADASRYFAEALASPTYGGRAKTFLSQGLCLIRAGQRLEAEQSLLHAYELDAGNPFTGYNLALVLYQRGEYIRAQFYVRRINNSDLANAETLWLGIRTERRLNNTEAVQQLAAQLRKRFGASRELAAYERGAFDD